MIDLNLQVKKTIYLAGIGGVSMSSLALTLIHIGHNVRGYDRTENEYIKVLRDKGVKIYIGNGSEGIEGSDIVIRTVAVKLDAPEMIKAKALGIPIYTRAEAWGLIMSEYRCRVCISGTHGKSSTTGFCTHIALKAKLDPFVMIGANLPEIGGSLRLSEEREMFIAEACEYYNSFLSFRPTVAVINSIDMDHPDFFRDLEDVKSSFRRFAGMILPGGAVVANFDNKNTRDTLEGIDTLWFGVHGGDITAKDITYVRGFPEFSLVILGKDCGRVKLRVPGEHNLYNALAAAAAMYAAGISAGDITAGLEDYRGIRRRFEIKGEVNDALVAEDYAHHPSELEAIIKTVSGMDFEKVIAVFQPHTFSRTRELYDDFVRVLIMCDKPVILPTFAARETDRRGIDEHTLANEVAGVYLDTFERAEEYIRMNAKEGDLVLILGAGDVEKLSNMLTKKPY
ncbi:MAG: UDP-N-acetylmuramate--L-alanine ligase [Clostridiales bacterium]|nr:UDP-N-acetylmuramate--L-alanine ligase [Clostridiales bacterium]